MSTPPKNMHPSLSNTKKDKPLSTHFKNSLNKSQGLASTATTRRKKNENRRFLNALTSKRKRKKNTSLTS